MTIIGDTSTVQWTEIITSITAVAAIVTAIVSIRFTKRIAKNSVRPLLSTIYVSRVDYCGIYLKNYGNGPAIITRIIFKKRSENVEYNGLHKAFPIENQYWESYYAFSQKEYYLSPNEDIFLAKLEAKFLIGKDKKYQELKEIFDQGQDNIMINIDYEDVFGNKMKSYQRNEIK